MISSKYLMKDFDEIIDTRHLQSVTSTDASDISKVFEVDDILVVRVDISEDIRVKTPLVSP
jgi:hypothetical protein